jgi:adenylosuccinate lyase
MRANLDASHGLYFSQRVLLALIEAGLQRDEAYRLVQEHALRAWDEELDFPALVEADGRIAGLIDLRETFDPAAYTSHVDAIFERLHNLTRNEEGVHV